MLNSDSSLLAESKVSSHEGLREKDRPAGAADGRHAELASAALMGLRTFYREGCRFSKSGVIFVELQPDTIRQGELDHFPNGAAMKHSPPRDRTMLVSSMDRVNERYGRGMLQLATASLAPAAKPRSMKAERRTPRYATI